MIVDVVEAVFRVRDETAASAASIRGTLSTLRADAQTTQTSFGKIGKIVLGSVATAASTAGVAILAWAQDHEKAMAAVARGTGATGAALDALQATAGRVAGGLRGDFVGVAEATANLNTATKLAGSELEILSRHVAQAAIGMNDDLGTAADDVGQLMRAFGLEGAAAGVALTDHLVAAAQDTGGTMGQLAGQVLRLSPSLQSMGLNAEEAATFVGRLNQAGVPADRVLRSLKTVTGEWVKEGINVRAMLDQSIDRVGRATSEQEAYRQAVALFGTSAAPGMVQAIRSGVVPALDDLAGELGDTSGSTQQLYHDTQTIADRFGEFRNRVTGMLGAVTPEFATVTTGIGTMSSAATGFATIFPGAMTVVQGAMTATRLKAILMWGGITGGVTVAIGLIWGFRDKIASALASVIGFMTTWAAGMLERAETAFGWIPGLGSKIAWAKDKLISLGTAASTALSNYASSFEDEAIPATEDLTTALDGGGGLAPTIEGVGTAAGDAADALGGSGGLGPAVEGVGTAAEETTTILQPLSSGISVLNDRLEATKKTTRDALNALIGSQGLTSGFQQVAAGAPLMSSSIGVSMLTDLPRAVESGIPAAVRAARDAGEDIAGGVSDEFRAVWSPDNVAGIFRQAFTGGGGVAGAVSAIGTDLGRQLTDSIGGALEERAAGLGSRLTSGIGGSFGPLGGLLSGALTGGISAAISFGMQALGKLGGWIKDKLFGGPSQGELAARDTFEAFRAAAVESLSGTAEFSREVSALMAQGWDRRLAEASAGFTTFAQSAGVGYEQARDLYGRFQGAVKSGDEAEMDRIMAIVEGWRERGGAIETGAETVVGANESISRSGAAAGGAVVHSAEEIGRQFRGLTADEAAKLGDALINLGSKGNRAFTDIHDSSLSAANAVAALVRRLKDALATEWRGTVRMTGVAAGGGERLTAAGGGVFRGPSTGYPVILHDTETVVPGAHPGLVARPPAPAAAGASRPVQIIINTDGTHSGRAVARAVARHLPAELRRAGVTI